MLLSTTWIIYSIDHLLDSKHFDSFQKIPNRYLFVSNNKPIILIFFVVIISINLYIIFDKLAFYQILFGIILCLISAVYIYTNHKIKSIFFPKELIISLVFSIAILLASNFAFNIIASVILFGLIFSNVLIYSLIGESEDKIVKMTSSVHNFGEKKIRLFLLLVLIATILFIISYDLKDQAILFVLVFYFLIVLLRLYKTKSSILRNFCDVFLVVLVF